jgi:Holliday junction resolvase RusA-like endonuclease
MNRRQHSFHIDCIPPKATAQASATILRRKDGTPFVGKMSSSNARKAQKTLIALMRPHVCHMPLKGAVALSVAFQWPFRKAEPKKNRAKGYIPCDKRPDCSNLIKMLEDIMTTLGFWGDDAQVAHLVVRKGWGDNPGISISISELTSQE